MSQQRTIEEVGGLMQVGDLVRHIHPRMRHKLHVITYIDDTFVRINGGGGLFGRNLFEVADENR